MRSKRARAQGKIDFGEQWAKVTIDPAAEKDPDLADALRAMMAARAAVGDHVVRGALLVVDRRDAPRPAVPTILVLSPSKWSAEMTATFGRMRGDVFVMVLHQEARPWVGGLRFLYDGPPMLA